MKLFMCALMAVGLLFVNNINAQDVEKKEEVNLKGIKCVVMGSRNASAKQAIEHNGAMVYVCCGKFKAAFTKNPEKFTAKANHQLVATGQYVQTSCPFSGGKLNDEAKVKVGGVELKMCCGSCVKKVNGAKDDAEKAELVFNKDAFKKGFTAKSKVKTEDKG